MKNQNHVSKCWGDDGGNGGKVGVVCEDDDVDDIEDSVKVEWMILSCNGIEFDQKEKILGHIVIKNIFRRFYLHIVNCLNCQSVCCPIRTHSNWRKIQFLKIDPFDCAGFWVFLPITRSYKKKKFMKFKSLRVSLLDKMWKISHRDAH